MFIRMFNPDKTGATVDGHAYTQEADGSFMVEEAHAEALAPHGFTTVPLEGWTPDAQPPADPPPAPPAGDEVPPDVPPAGEPAPEDTTGGTAAPEGDQAPGGDPGEADASAFLADLATQTKAQIQAYALEAYGLELKSTLTKDAMLEAVVAAAAQAADAQPPAEA